jgi:hypothetical protein
VGTGTADRCINGHSRPDLESGLVKWYCPTCWRATLFSADRCAAGHTRPADPVGYMGWSCPHDGCLDPVFGSSVDRSAAKGRAITDVNLANGYTSHLLGYMGGDPGGVMTTVGAPLLAGFAFAAAVTVSLTDRQGLAAGVAVTCFAAAAIAILFGLEFSSLRLQESPIRDPKKATDVLYEVGILLILGGLLAYVLAGSWGVPKWIAVGILIASIAIDIGLQIAVLRKHHRIGSHLTDGGLAG